MHAKGKKTSTSCACGDKSMISIGGAAILALFW